MSELTLSEARKLFLSKRLFVVCGTCPKWHSGAADGKSGCNGVACGGPISRKDYPEYSGEIKDFSGFCFACGSEDVLAYAQVAGSDKKFGLCKDHLEIIDDFVANTKDIEAQTKVMIYPRADRVMEQFKQAQHTV